MKNVFPVIAIMLIFGALGFGAWEFKKDFVRRYKEGASKSRSVKLVIFYQNGLKDTLVYEVKEMYGDPHITDKGILKVNGENTVLGVKRIELLNQVK